MDPNIFSKRSDLINSSAIRRVFDLAAQKKNPINLSIGQPDFEIPPQVKEALSKAISDNFTGYTPTQGILTLREKLAEKFKSENDLLGFESSKLTAENIIISPGVSALLYLLFAVLIDPGDEIILIDPYFLMYDALAKYFQAKVHYIRESNIAEDLEKIASSKVKFLLYSSPSNPTGKIIDGRTLTQVAKVLAKDNIWVVSDEIYEKFDYENTHFSIGSIYPKTITLNGFSKAYAMTGLRLGYASAPKDILNKMATIQQYTFVCAPFPSQVAGETALSVDMSGYIREYKKRRDFVYESLKNSFDINKPDGAFYIYPRISNSAGIKSEEFANQAINENILVVPGNIFSQREGSFRISFAASMGDLEQGARKLKKLAENLTR